MKRAPAKEFSDLFLWQKAHGLVLFIYSLSRTFPKYELYGLTSQKGILLDLIYWLLGTGY